MNCPKCGGGTVVTHTRTFQNYTRRHRVCSNCGKKITTYETFAPPGQRYPMGHGWSRKNTPSNERSVCRYNSGVCCDQTSCDGCGWNPNKRRADHEGVHMG